LHQFGGQPTAADQPERQARVADLEGVQSLGQPRRKGAAHRADGQIAARLHPAVAFEEQGVGRQNRPRRLDIGTAAAGQPGRTAGAVEQSQAQLVFQVAHLLADRRLGQIHRLGGAGERTIFRHRDQGCELPQVHADPRSLGYLM
jgi:hypothetical protein